MNDLAHPGIVDLFSGILSLIFALILVALIYLKSWLMFFAALAVVIFWVPSLFGAIAISAVFFIAGIFELARASGNIAYALLWWIAAFLSYYYHMGRRGRPIEQIMYSEPDEAEAV